MNPRLYRNIIFTFVGILYFILYYLLSHDYILEYFSSKIYYGKYILSYFNAIIGFSTTVGVIGICNRIFQYFMNKFFDRDREEFFFLDILYGFISVTKYFIAIYVFINFAILPDFFELYISKFYSISIILVVVFYITKFINKFFDKDLAKKAKIKSQGKTLLPFVNKIIVVFIWIVGIITIFDNIGYNISALVAGAGIGGLAIAFAAQKSISNIFGAINILLNKPFVVGDYVSINGVTGTVKDIGLSYLTIIDKMGHQVMIPNEVIISNNVENFTVRENRRTDFSIGVVYGTSLQKMNEGVRIIESILQKHVEEGTVASYRVNFEMFAEFSLNIQTTYFSLVNDSVALYLKQKENINLEIKDKFKEAGLEMAFPTRELIIRKES